MKVSGDTIDRLYTACPECGPGFFMGKHKNRSVCGNCGYTEFNQKKKGKK